MSEMKQVYKAIVSVQADLAKEGISKDKTCTQGASYKFRGIDDVYNSLARLLAENNLCILPRMLKRDSIERISKTGGAVFYTTVDAEFVFVCAVDGSNHVVGPIYGEAMDSGDKGMGKAMSYAYKAMAFQTFCIPTEGDNDTENQTHEVKPKSEIPPTKTELSPEQTRCFSLIKAALDKIYGGDVAAKKTLIRRLTTFTNKEGKEIQGIEDYRKKSGKGLEILTKQIEKMAADMAEDIPDFCSECHKPQVDGKCTNLDCPESA